MRLMIACTTTFMLSPSGGRHEPSSRDVPTYCSYTSHFAVITIPLSFLHEKGGLIKIYSLFLLHVDNTVMPIGMNYFLNYALAAFLGLPGFDIINIARIVII